MQCYLLDFASIFPYRGRYVPAWNWVNHFCSYVKTQGLSWPSLFVFLSITAWFIWCSWSAPRKAEAALILLTIVH